MTTKTELIKGPDVETIQKQVKRWMQDQWPTAEIEEYRNGELFRYDSWAEITVIEQPNGSVEVTAPTKDDIFRDLIDHLSGGMRAQEQGGATFSTVDEEIEAERIEESVDEVVRPQGVKNGEDSSPDNEDVVVKPFSQEEADYYEPGEPDFDETHEKCKDCAHFDGHGNCMIVPGIDPEGYCTELFADVGFFGHEDMGMVEVNLAIFGEGFDWETENAEDFLDEIAENLSERVK